MNFRPKPEEVGPQSCAPGQILGSEVPPAGRKEKNNNNNKKKNKKTPQGLSGILWESQGVTTESVRQAWNILERNV